MDRSDRALLYDSGKKGRVHGVELGRHSWRRNIDETVHTLLIEPDHPVPQRLTIHAANLGRVLPRGAVEQPQSLTAVAPAQHPSPAGQAGEPHRQYSPS